MKPQSYLQAMQFDHDYTRQDNRDDNRNYEILNLDMDHTQFCELTYQCNDKFRGPCRLR
jgi:hypothetical protein